MNSVLMSPHVFCAARLLPTLPALLIVVGIAVNGSSAQDLARPNPHDDDRVKRFDEMKQIAGTFQAAVIDDDKRTPAPLTREPLYRWTDPTRLNSDGTLWAWRASGRPIAVLAVELYSQDKVFGPIWAIEFTSLSTGLFEVTGGEHFDRRYPDLFPPRADGTLRWAPAKGGLAFCEVSGAPTPGTGEVERLRQMKDLAKRFAAREFYDITSQDYALRLVAHPIDRYADPASGLVDGANFAFANGTNPEALLVIEARRHGAGSPTWSYAAAPLTRAEPTLRLDRQDVWTYSGKPVPTSEDPYFLARKPRSPSSRD
jgi:hypothetical protein